MEKIKMQTPLVEMDGEEMTRILWQIIKDELLTPYLELNTEYYDLGLEHRNETDDQVTIDAAALLRARPQIRDMHLPVCQYKILYFYRCHHMHDVQV